MHPFPYVRGLVRACLAAALLALSALAPARADEAQEVGKLLHSGQIEQAAARADQFLAANPKDAQMRFLKAVILTDQKKPAEAINMLIGLTADFPELPEPYNNLAVIYASQAQYDKARAALEMAVRVAPSWATAHENLGDVYVKLAAQSYEKTVQFEPNNANAARKLALARELGARAAAKK